MTDDVQYFGDGHACACAHCRKLLKEHTGYELPKPGAEWNAWHGNYDDPSYIAWLDFRFRSTNDFHMAVKSHYEKAESRSLKGFWAWSQACYRQNIPFDLFQAEELDRLSLYRVVVLNETAFLSDKEMNAFRAFVRNGGILVWTGATGIKDDKGIDRGENSISHLWRNDNVSVIQDGGSPVIHDIGNGKLVMMSGDYGLSRVEGTCHADRWQPHEVRIPYYPPTENEWKIRRKITGFLLDLLPDGPDMEINNLPADVLATLFETEKGGSMVVHLVNAGGTLDVKPGTEVGHSDPILFPRYTGRPKISIQVRKPDHLSNRSVKTAYYHDPESDDDPVHLKTTDEGNRINILIDPSLIGFYGLIEITF